MLYQQPMNSGILPFFQYKFEDLIRALFHRQMQIFLLCNISCIRLFFFPLAVFISPFIDLY